MLTYVLHNFGIKLSNQSSFNDKSLTSDEVTVPNPAEYQEMKMRAEAAEARLRRIYATPIWKYSKFLRKIYARLNQRLDSRKVDEYVFKPNELEGQSVLALIKNRVDIEFDNANWQNDSFAVIAQFSKDPRFSESLNRYVKEFLENSYSVIVVSACESPAKFELDHQISQKITLVRKPNIGYDFGSWACCLNLFPILHEKNQLILTNDSLIGPFEKIDSLIKKLEDSKFDLTGITDTSQMHYHLQSYLVHFKKLALQNENLKTFLMSVRHHTLKNDVILKYELGLTRTAQLSGLYVGAIFPWNLIVRPETNPSLNGWERLIDLGFPFLKREAVRKASYPDRAYMRKKIIGKYPDSKFAVNEIKLIAD